MRTLIDIPNSQIKLVDEVAQKLGTSRADLVRKAISAFLEPHKSAKEQAAFGLWAGRQIDGLEYQDRMRAEW